MTKLNGRQIYETTDPTGATALPPVQLPEMAISASQPDDVVAVDAETARERDGSTQDDASRWAYYPGDDASSNLPAIFYVYDARQIPANTDGSGNTPNLW